MEVSDEKLKTIAEEYGTTMSHIIRYYNLLRHYPCVINNDEELFYECLQTLIQDRISETFQSQEKDFFDTKSLDYSISDALYRVYQDEAIPYLDAKYVELNDLRYHIM